MIQFIADSQIILRSNYTKKWKLILDLFRLYFRSFKESRLNTKKRQVASFIGFKINYKDCPTLINLIREIFIYECYRVEDRMKINSVVDIGSHIGISLLYFKYRYPNCSIEAYEPDENNQAYLKQNVEVNNLSNIVIHEYALGAEEGRVKLNRKNSGVSNKVIKDETGTIEMKRASMCLSGNESLLKIDVEGMENQIMDDLIECDLIHSKAVIFVETEKSNFSLGHKFLDRGFKSLETSPKFYSSHPETVYRFEKVKK